MKHRLVLIGMCALVVALLSAPRPRAQAPATGGAPAAAATISGDLLKDWTNLRKTMMDIADAMPEDKFGYKSTEPQRTYGQQIMHVAGANVMIMKMLGGKATPPAMAPDDAKAQKPKADILKALGDSFDYGIAVIREQTDETMLQTVQGPPYMGPSTRARMVYATIGHCWDIYGQMAVYLRLNGVTPPRSRGM